MKTEDIAKAAQACFQGCPTVILGSGASIPHGLPSMNLLSDYLRDNLKVDGALEENSWCPVNAALSNGSHLEAALEGRTLPDTLLSKIVALTWRCVNEKDMKLLDIAASR